MSLLSVKDIGKAYRTYASEFQRFASWFGVCVTPSEENWVLRGVTFVVEKGESIGIVGQNGAGKSTLLKMIAGTLKQTEGEIDVKIRIAAILELGMGFDQELTGRQNVYHVAGLMGISNKQVSESIADIENFAEINEYFDEPIRTYSSGMQMRVAFSVATAFSPDLLIIDEALSVGDAYFQRKCMYRISKYQEQGGTLLFVSHDRNAIQTICSRAILIDSGKVIADGFSKDIMDLYDGLISKKTDLGERKVSFKKNDTEGYSWNKATSITANGDADLLEFKITDSQENELIYIESETTVKLTYLVRLKKFFEKPAFGIIIRDKLGRSIFEISTYALRMEVHEIQAGSIVSVSFEVDFNVIAGLYTFSVGVSNKGYARSDFEEISLLMHDVEQIQVVESPDVGFYGGTYNMRPKITIECSTQSNISSIENHKMNEI